MAILALFTLALTAGTAVAAAATETLFFSSFIDISNLPNRRSQLIYDRISRIFFPNFFLSILYPLLEKFLHLPLPFSRSASTARIGFPQHFIPEPHHLPTKFTTHSHTNNFQCF
jgi:hypothetical protein